jgi:hypothetical protein
MLFLILIAGSASIADETNSAVYGRGNDAYTTSGGIAQEKNVIFMTWPSGAGKGERWLVSIDVAKPEQPALLGKLPLDGFPQDLAITGTHAFVVNGIELLVIDISNPASPALIKRLPMADATIRGPQGIDIKDAMAYLACRRGGVKAVDISNPREPKIVASCGIPGFARDVTVIQDFLYVANDTKGIHILGIETSGRFKDFGRFAVPRGCIGHIRATGETAYLSGGDTLVTTVSIKEASKPIFLGSTDDRNILSPLYGSYSHDLSLMETFDKATGAKRVYACVVDGESGLIVTDVSSPDIPVFTGELMEGVKVGSPYVLTGICLRGTTAYVIDDMYGMRVIDISTPIKPVLIGEGVCLTHSKQK